MTSFNSEFVSGVVERKRRLVWPQQAIDEIVVPARMAEALKLGQMRLDAAKYREPITATIYVRGTLSAADD